MPSLAQHSKAERITTIYRIATIIAVSIAIQAIIIIITITVSIRFDIARLDTASSASARLCLQRASGPIGNVFNADSSGPCPATAKLLCRAYPKLSTSSSHGRWLRAMHWIGFKGSHSDCRDRGVGCRLHIRQPRPSYNSLEWIITTATGTKGQHVAAHHRNKVGRPLTAASARAVHSHGLAD